MIWTVAPGVKKPGVARKVLLHGLPGGPKLREPMYYYYRVIS